MQYSCAVMKSSFCCVACLLRCAGDEFYWPVVIEVLEVQYGGLAKPTDTLNLMIDKKHL